MTLDLVENQLVLTTLAFFEKVYLRKQQQKHERTEREAAKQKVQQEAVDEHNIAVSERQKAK